MVSVPFILALLLTVSSLRVVLPFSIFRLLFPRIFPPIDVSPFTVKLLDVVIPPPILISPLHVIFFDTFNLLDVISCVLVMLLVILLALIFSD